MLICQWNSSNAADVTASLTCPLAVHENLYNQTKLYHFLTSNGVLTTSFNCMINKLVQSIAQYKFEQFWVDSKWMHTLTSSVASVRDLSRNLGIFQVFPGFRDFV